jgi:Fur family transcriptional regulator, peroxide stress response regulator
MTPQTIADRLREWGVRVTPQRLAIAEAVLNSEDHPSVQQIFERVRDHFPSMTLATIYSTLDVLERSGLIQELPFPQFSRYESNMDPHVNLVCIQCGNVIDSTVGQQTVVRLREQISGQSNFQVAWQRVDFHGWCRRCAAQKHAPAPQPQGS